MPHIFTFMKYVIELHPEAHFSITLKMCCTEKKKRVKPLSMKKIEKKYIQNFFLTLLEGRYLLSFRVRTLK